MIPHSDGSGVIDELGAGVAETNGALRKGARVWLFNAQWFRPHGTAAEFVTLPVGQVVALPDNVSFEAGASIGIPLMTAAHAVEACGAIVGRYVIVTGAAGAVGIYATQLAQIGGAEVIAVISNDEKATVVLTID